MKVDPYSRYSEVDAEYVSHEDEKEALFLMESYYEFKKENYYE